MTGYLSARSAWVTFGWTTATVALTLRSTPGTVSACAIRCFSTSRLTRMPVCSLTSSSDGKLDLGVLRRPVEPALDAPDQLVDGVLGVADPRRDLGALLAAGEVARDAVTMLPSRLFAIASSTMPPTSAVTPASSAERLKRLPW